MSEYGSKVLYPHIPTGGVALPVNNMPSFKLQAGEKNSLAGQYKAGDVIISYTGIGSGLYAQKATINTNTRRMHQRLSLSDSDSAMALLLVPKNWISKRNVQNNDSNFQNQLLVDTYEKEPFSWDVWLLTNKPFIRVGQSGSESKNVQNISYEDTGKSVTGYPQIGQVGSTSVSFWSGGGGWYYTINNTLQNKVTLAVDYYFYAREARETIPEQMTALSEEYADASAVFGGIYATIFNSAEWDSVFRPSLQIISSLPIFGYNDLDAVYRYFKFGDNDGINKDDMKLSEVDFATDWTIYVNGARRPNIYITMESQGVEDFIANNQMGYSKEDFLVQYRYPIKVVQDVNNPSIKTVDYGADQYNNTRATSYSELIDLNYPSITPRNPEYAELQFRVVLADNPDLYYSAWCGIGIGIIGSPSIAEFASQQNWGNVVSLDDGSTVTIIYDQVPDDVDEYEDPEDVPDDDTDPTDFSLASALTTTYKVEFNQLQLLGNELWNKTFIDDIHLINNSPIENIVSCKRIPFNIPSGVSRSIVLGNITNAANGNLVSNVPIIDVGSVTYHGYHGNFLDYAPYTRLILFLPFCGFVNIDAAAVTGKTLDIKYAIDIILGKCKAMLYINNSYYMSVDGDCGIDIPLVASNRAQTESAFAIQGLESALQGEPLGVLGAAVSTQYHSSRNGSYTPTCAWQETRKCFMIADIPTVQYPSSYAHDIGYPCMLTRTLATMSGFTVCTDDIDMSGFSCTSEEMDMIKQILTTGIYL